MGPKGQAKLDKIADQAEVLRALTDGLSGVRELEARIADLFADDPGRANVVCSSIHRAKGLEADRVWLLADTLYPPLPCQCGHRHPYGSRGAACDKCACPAHSPDPARVREEENLEYVAITRAKADLVRVNGLP